MYNNNILGVKPQVRSGQCRVYAEGGKEAVSDRPFDSEKKKHQNRYYRQHDRKKTFFKAHNCSFLL